ncbi:hypothetical protein GRI42_03265 [Erythrobacter gaetbuli]|uniref:Uncharacterized protein n=1 Tax=Qipengyuania gaetbuli TaxID=266952 RepID=A0A844XWN3_9SPHN|nr:hypothetical protein [Qipengyuania gaetbuli]MXO50320.1 hypothetical protein [Qipengyuania gaetbuli]
MESINAKIDAIRAREEAIESPRVRAAREALEAAIAADRAEGYNPRRDPEHEMYNPNHARRTHEDGEVQLPEWWDDEVAEMEAEEEENRLRLRTLKDEGWD